MRRMIITYLVVTGIGAAAVLAMPWLVAIGLVLLIIPGLILAVLPSAFCYGLGFAVIWFPLYRILGQGVAAVVAVVGTFALFWMVPVAGNRATEARYNAELAGDHLPSAPIALSGDIRLESASLLAEHDREKRDRRAAPSVRYDRARCSALCAALLFTKGVTSVTVTTSKTDAPTPQPLSPDAITFRLVPRTGCTAPIEPSFDYNQFGSGALGALRDDWNLRLSTSDCIVTAPPVAQADFILLSTHFKTPMTATYEQRPKALSARPVTVRRFEIFHAGKSLLRSTLAQSTRLYQPLFYGPVDGFFRSDFASEDLGARYAQLDEIALLAAHTSLQVTPDDRIAAHVRERIGQLLDDPAIPASNPGFTLTDRFFKAMADDGAPEADVALLRRVIGDDRFVAFDGIWAPAARLGPRLEALRAPIVARLRRADPTTQGALSQLGRVLSRLRPGAFASLEPGEAELLADYDRHVFARFLIERQGDRGPVAVPLLMEILERQLRWFAADDQRPNVGDREARARRESARDAIDGVRVALCRMGPAAASARPATVRLEREGLFGRRLLDRRDWHMALARVGWPVESIPKPANLSGTEQHFHADLRRRLERFDLLRDCQGS